MYAMQFHRNVDNSDTKKWFAVVFDVQTSEFVIRRQTRREDTVLTELVSAKDFLKEADPEEVSAFFLFLDTWLYE